MGGCRCRLLEVYERQTAADNVLTRRPAALRTTLRRRMTVWVGLMMKGTSDANVRG